MSFKTINPIINGYMQFNHQKMADGILFVVLTIKTPFHTVANQMRDVREKGLDSEYLWGFKRDTYKYLQAHSKDLYDDLMALWLMPKKELGGNADTKDAAMMYRLLEVPGLGAAKAGFVMQMMFGRVGCMDVHNIRRFRNVQVKDFHFAQTAKPETKFKKLMNYVQLCKGHRSTEKLWDSWCEQLTYKTCNRNRFASGDEVSNFHWVALTAGL